MGYYIPMTIAARAPSPRTVVIVEYKVGRSVEIHAENARTLDALEKAIMRATVACVDATEESRATLARVTARL